jgi:diguanylate cyclase (GGDEF)-like protein
MPDVDRPVHQGGAWLSAVPPRELDRVSARDDSTPVVPAHRLLEVAAALSDGASRVHARLRHLDPRDRDEVLELVTSQVAEIVALWSDLVRDVVPAGEEEPALARRGTDRRSDATGPEPVLERLDAGNGFTGDARQEEAEARWRPAGSVGDDPWDSAYRRDEVPGDSASYDVERLTRDELTGVLNRQAGLAALDREVDRCRRSGERLVLGFLNVDRLKALNESRGPRAGDELLRKVAAALRATLRSYDVVVRLGGDEFLFSLPGADFATAELRFNEFCVLLGEEASGTTASVGFGELREGDTLDDLISRADTALVKNRRGRRRLR